MLESLETSIVNGAEAKQAACSETSGKGPKFVIGGNVLIDIILYMPEFG